MSLDKNLCTVQVYIYVLRGRSLTVEREDKQTVSVLTHCQNLIITQAEFKETNKTLCKRRCYINMAQL